MSERTPAYRGGSFLLQREQRHGLQRVAAAYTLSTGVDSRAPHGILWITSGKYPPGFFSNIDGSVLIAVMVTATFRAIPFPYRQVLGFVVLISANMAQLAAWIPLVYLVSCLPCQANLYSSMFVNRFQPLSATDLPKLNLPPFFRFAIALTLISSMPMTS